MAAVGTAAGWVAAAGSRSGWPCWWRLRRPGASLLPAVGSVRGGPVNASTDLGWDRGDRDADAGESCVGDHLRFAGRECSPRGRGVAGAAGLPRRHLGDLLRDADLADRLPH